MKRAVILETVTFVMLIVALALALVAIDSNRDLARQGKQARDGLCALKADLRERVAAGNSFLDAHPSGAFGISAAAIRTSITNQEATLTALHVIVCAADPPAKASA